MAFRASTQHRKPSSQATGIVQLTPVSFHINLHSLCRSLPSHLFPPVPLEIWLPFCISSLTYVSPDPRRSCLVGSATNDLSPCYESPSGALVGSSSAGHTPAKDASMPAGAPRHPYRKSPMPWSQNAYPWPWCRSDEAMPWLPRTPTRVWYVDDRMLEPCDTTDRCLSI